MFAEQFDAAVSAASLNQLDQLARSLWRAHASGAVADDEAQRLAEAIEVRRAPAREARQTVGIPVGRATIFPPKRVQRSPDRAKSIERRRTLAASGPMPPQLACRFTTGELAVLAIVAEAVRNNGQCVLPVDAIAARAGVCRRLAQGAIREAAQQGLLTVQERRRDGRRNDYNIVRIVSAEWLTWIARRIGCKKLRPTDTKLDFRKKEGSWQRSSLKPAPRSRASPGPVDSEEPGAGTPNQQTRPVV